MKDIVYILLPVHNRRDTTRKFVDCLSAQTHQNFHLLLIDDGSSDGTERMVRNIITNLSVLKGNGRWWWAGSLQQGINWLKKNECSPDAIILFVNDDVTFEPFFLENAILFLRDKDKTLLLAQLFDCVSSEIKESGVNADLNNLTFKIASNPDEINCLSTRGLFLRFNDLIKIGGFHPYLIPQYGSDYEFTIRAYKKGFDLCTTKEVAVCPDKEQTGYRSIDANNIFEFLRKYFSKRSVGNPIYQSLFIILSAANESKPRLILSVWITALKIIIKQILMNLKGLNHKHHI